MAAEHVGLIVAGVVASAIGARSMWKKKAEFLNEWFWGFEVTGWDAIIMGFVGVLFGVALIAFATADYLGVAGARPALDVLRLILDWG